MKNNSSLTLKKRVLKMNRDWVKNALIVFLAIMLILTFFSNTIMNHSLPKVTAQYPQSTTITTKIRGTGTVEACQSYDVNVEETRTVSAVNVVEGDKVSVGDILIVLDKHESQELQDARASLFALETEYKKMTAGKGTQGQADYVSLQQLRDAVNQAKTDLTEANNYERQLQEFQTQVTIAKNAATTAQQTLNNTNTEIQLLQNEKDSIRVNHADYLQADQKVIDAQEKVDQIEDTASADLDVAKAELEQATTEREQLYHSLTIALDQQIADANERRILAESSVADAQSEIENANTALNQFQNEHPNGKTVAAAEAALRSAKQALASAEAAMQDAAAAKSYESNVAQIEIGAMEQKLEDAREKVAALEEQAGEAKIASTYSGIVQSVNVAAGDKTTPDMPLIVIELIDQGYLLKASVTKEQARVLSEGMQADITNLWNSDITMTLESITTDRENAASGRILTFSVKGDDVTVGQQLSFSVGDRNASYDVVIPSSALHTDSDGSFVYSVEVKSSPLGNRYTVKRTDVQVIASDDTSSAISGELSTADFVITNSTVPLNVGDQVRIAE